MKLKTINMIITLPLGSVMYPVYADLFGVIRGAIFLVALLAFWNIWFMNFNEEI